MDENVSFVIFVNRHKQSFTYAHFVSLVGSSECLSFLSSQEPLLLKPTQKKKREVSVVDRK